MLAVGDTGQGTEVYAVSI